MNDKVPVLQACSVSKFYEDAGNRVEVLNQIDFSLSAGSKTAIIGSSGSGKSTLLNILGGLDSPTSGNVILSGQDIHACTEDQRCKMRNEKLGFVYQFHHLLPEFSALENVAMPLLLRNQSVHDVQGKAEEILRKVGLSARLQHKPSQLSGGERQRVAIARALIGSPDVVLMDEPTGNLDRSTAKSIQALIDELNQSSSIAFVLVTHDHELASKAEQVVELVDGQLQQR